MHHQTAISKAKTLLILGGDNDPKKSDPNTTVRHEHVIVERDSKSRTIKDEKIDVDVELDVEVNDRPEIMGDEGPVADDNPHNRRS